MRSGLLKPSAITQSLGSPTLTLSYYNPINHTSISTIFHAQQLRYNETFTPPDNCLFLLTASPPFSQNHGVYLLRLLSHPCPSHQLIRGKIVTLYNFQCAAGNVHAPPQSKGPGNFSEQYQSLHSHRFFFFCPLPIPCFFCRYANAGMVPAVTPPPRTYPCAS